MHMTPKFARFATIAAGLALAATGGYHTVKEIKVGGRADGIT